MANSRKNLIIFISLILTLPCQAIAANDELVFALDLIRHGARTSTEDLPTAPHNWTEGKGQLTALGMQQAYQLGLKLNQRYKVDNQLLPTNYQVNTIYIRSTDYDRTLMSAQSLLMGLYPLGTGPALPDANPALPANFQPIPIHTVPTAQDSAFLINIGSNEYSDLLDKYVYTRADWIAKSSELQIHYPRWSQLTGLNIENMFDVLRVGDILTTYVTHDIPLPEGLSQEEAHKIIEAGDWIFATLFKPQQVGDVAGKAGLQKIIGYIQQATKQNTKTKFILLSAHDITTLGVMSALHVPLDTSPSYASDLNFSLYKSASDNYYVKVTYNNTPVSIPGCDGYICQLKQFTEWAK
jgi:hypothetical protein